MHEIEFRYEPLSWRIGWIILPQGLTDQILDATSADYDLGTRTYLAWSNSLRRDLEALGLKAPEKQAPKLAEFLSVKKVA